MLLRPAALADVPAMARLRAASWGTEGYWRRRLSGYMAGDMHPREALAARAVYVAVRGEERAGLIAGHLTRRFGCDGELEWIEVAPPERGTGVADDLLRQLAGWFLERGARRVCVDVQPDNHRARRFYARHGARDLAPHWMVWDDLGVIAKEA